MHSRKLFSIVMLALGLTLAGCGESEGPAERAGEKIDESMEAAKEKLEETGEKMGDAMEEAGDKVEEATDN